MPKRVVKPKEPKPTEPKPREPEVKQVKYQARPQPQTIEQQKVPIYERRRPELGVPIDILRKAKAVKPGVEVINTRSGIPVSVPAIVLVDENGNDLVTLPWRLVRTTKL